MIVKDGNSLIAVYLAGGFFTEWQQKVIEACKDLPFWFLSPNKGWVEKAIIGPDATRLSQEVENKKEELDKAKRQSPWWHWDKLAIKNCDVLFLNCEDYKNFVGLRGTGDIFEAGMAWAQDKLVIFVNQVEHRYYRGIARNFLMFETLEEGIDCLKFGKWILR